MRPVCNRGGQRSPGPAGGISVEFERSGKTTEEYGRVLRWYGAALDDRRVRWFCATPALRRRVADLVERERMGDFISAEPVPPAIPRLSGRDAPP
jgi:hypothetical protein